MKIHLGYVSIPLSIGYVTPSSTMTYTNYKKLSREDALKKLNDIIHSNFYYTAGKNILEAL